MRISVILSAFKNDDIKNSSTSAESSNEFQIEADKFADIQVLRYQIEGFEDLSLKEIKKIASGRVEKEVIAFILEKVGWNRSLAAKILKISYKALLYKINDLEVQPLLTEPLMEDQQPHHVC